MKADIIIRNLEPAGRGILKTMLYNAIYIPPEERKPPPEIIELPEIALYIEDFGRKGDICLVAEASGEIAGAVWTRLFGWAGPRRLIGAPDESTWILRLRL